MGKLGIFGIFIVVCVGHFFALKSAIAKQNHIPKPKAKVHHITLSSVVVKKPVAIAQPPKPEPIILPPDPEPTVKPEPKPKPKPKKRVKKPVAIPKPIVEEIIQKAAPLPVVEQIITPVATIDTASIKDRYTSQIRTKIRNNLIYPKMAKRLRIQDVVKVTFYVQKDGSITDIRVLNSPKKLLQNAAIKTLKSLSLEPIPSQLDEEFLDITIPIEFKLIQG